MGSPPKHLTKAGEQNVRPLSTEDQSEMMSASEIISVIINKDLVLIQYNSVSLMISTAVTDFYRHQW